jgi:hypothetical protein
MSARVILHLEPRYHEKYRLSPRLVMFKLIEDIITARGGQVELRAPIHGRLPDDLARGDGDLHIVENGNARGFGWLNSNLAYLTGFWHMRAQGIYSAKDMAARGPLLPATPPDPVAAAAFFARLMSHFKDGRRARHKQPKTVQHDLPKGAIAVFLQGPAPLRYQQNYFLEAEILETVARRAGGRPVLVKPHPLFAEQGAELIGAARAQGLDIIPVDAHVHDVLAAADVTVSINSAAAIEGFLHGKPAIICGAADFAPLAETLLDPDDFSGALQRALSVPRDYAPWLYWYLTRYAIDLAAPDLADQILARFAAAGFDSAALGLNGAA